MNEVWKPLVSNKLYKISNLGRVKLIKRLYNGGRYNKYLTVYKTAAGVHCVNINSGTKNSKSAKAYNKAAEKYHKQFACTNKFNFSKLLKESVIKKSIGI